MLIKGWECSIWFGSISSPKRYIHKDKKTYRVGRSLYRPSYLIEAYVWPEKYWLVWAGPLANHPFNFKFIFLSDGATAAAERATCFADLYRR